jgi:hypothetical protein
MVQRVMVQRVMVQRVMVQRVMVQRVMVQRVMVQRVTVQRVTVQRKDALRATLGALTKRVETAADAARATDAESTDAARRAICTYTIRTKPYLELTIISARTITSTSANNRVKLNYGAHRSANPTRTKSSQTSTNLSQKNKLRQQRRSSR